MRKSIKAMGLLSLAVAASVSIFMGGNSTPHATATGETNPSLLNPGKMTAEERINHFKGDLEDLKANPTAQNTVLISLDSLKNKEFVRQLVSNRDVKVNKLFHAFPAAHNTISGLYVARSNETLDQSLADYETQINTMIADKLTQLKAQEAELATKAQSAAQDEKAQEDRLALQAVRNSISDLEQQQASMAAKGLEIYGLQVSGQNADLLTISEQANVKLVEKMSKEKAKWNPILPMGGTR